MIQSTTLFTKKIISLPLVLFAMGTYAQNEAKTLDSLFTALHSQNKFNGNVLVAEKGKPIFEKSYGLADEGNKRKLDVQSTFELASVSKQFTAMGIVLLQKAGKLNYDDKISKYLPELSFYDKITVRNLLNHTSGLPDYMELFEKNWNKSKFAVNDDIIKEFAKYKPTLEFEPNQQFEYSNTGYAFLASIIERVSKKPFGEFLSQNIFKPLDMKHTLVYRSRYQPQSVSNYALGYETDESGKKVLLDSHGKEYYTYYLDGIVGDGMVNSTLEDLLKWDRALYTNKLVNEDDKKLIFNDVTTANGKASNYGFGWFVKKTSKYGKIANHSGGWAGYATFIERHLDNDKTFILLQNNRTPLTKIPSDDIRKILYHEKLGSENLKKASLSADQLQVYSGVYAAPNFPMKIKIFVQIGALYGQAEGQQAFELTAYENHIFKFDSADIRMVFDPAKNTMDFTQGGSPKFTFSKEK
ncbi:serine hydrolase domain-containing protein [Chryseobacterium sp. ES2]|uniref:Serine hydrolase domain-containing protein n=1 Tax=Chryseobacterium metallicongregator TaxID=3073042 RepID=A0ABU1E8P0_9FLAO|nr:serine hydrolase domain-containing protein [Chryseobacterium sp. ES2]MDR4954111.1 serine hydrolase domain-containing protein [Chryseobacterium sp. ES2]